MERPKILEVREKEVKMEKPERESWDAYFMKLAEAVASRATCPRKKVGALIVRDKFVLSTGYNGAPRGLPHCFDEGCLLINNHCVRGVHAEQNAIISAAVNGVDIRNATLYCLAFPCLICSKITINSGIKRICFKDMYYKDEYKQEIDVATEMFRQAEVELVQLK